MVERNAEDDQALIESEQEDTDQDDYQVDPLNPVVHPLESQGIVPKGNESNSDNEHTYRSIELLLLLDFVVCQEHKPSQQGQERHGNVEETGEPEEVGDFVWVGIVVFENLKLPPEEPVSNLSWFASDLVKHDEHTKGQKHEVQTELNGTLVKGVPLKHNLINIW